MEIIESFTKNFTLIEGTTITISLLAILISILTYYNNASRDRRQLRANKIEEMIETVILIIDCYGYFDDLFCLQQSMRLGSDADGLNEREKKTIDVLRQISDEIKLRDKIIRLNVLANTYLPNNDLKNRVRSLVSIISTIHEPTVNKNYEQTKTIYKTYPRAWTLLPFVQKLQVDLTKEMKLGYESDMFSHNSYHETFFKELKLK